MGELIFTDKGSSLSPQMKQFIIIISLGVLQNKDLVSTQVLCLHLMDNYY